MYRYPTPFPPFTSIFEALITATIGPVTWNDAVVVLDAVTGLDPVTGTSLLETAGVVPPPEQPAKLNASAATAAKDKPFFKTNSPRAFWANEVCFGIASPAVENASCSFTFASVNLWYAHSFAKQAARRQLAVIHQAFSRGAELCAKMR